jgi:hypothetical protein
MRRFVILPINFDSDRIEGKEEIEGTKGRKSERTTRNEINKTRVEEITCILLYRLNYSGVILSPFLLLRNEKTYLKSPEPCSNPVRLCNE